MENPPRILLATANNGKVEELRALLDETGWTLCTLGELGLTEPVSETGSTYRENAALKARAYGRRAGLPALADDSGLEVEALGGAPGLHSARYLPEPGATDRDRWEHLLSQLQGRPRPWTARFRSATAAWFPGERFVFGEGVCPGEIIPTARGAGGFGYDPVFQLPSGLTMAELPPVEKNRLSHRARAIADMLPRLRAVLAAQ